MTSRNIHWRWKRGGLKVEPSKVQTKVQLARERHGKPFAFEKGSNWTPRAVPVLTEWMQHRTKEEKK